MKKPKSVCLKCQREAGSRADSQERHLDYCYLDSDPIHAPSYSAGLEHLLPAGGAAAGDSADGGTAATDRVLVLRATGGQVRHMQWPSCAVRRGLALHNGWTKTFALRSVQLSRRRVRCEPCPRECPH